MVISFHYQWKNVSIIIRNYRRKIVIIHYVYTADNTNIDKLSVSGKYILILQLTHRQMIRFFLRIIIKQFYGNTQMSTKHHDEIRQISDKI